MSPSAERDPLKTPRLTGGRDALERALRPLWARLLYALVAAVILVGGAAALLAPWLYSPSALIASISGQLQDATGLYVATKGRPPRFSLAPRPHVSIDGVAFADRAGALVIEADELHGVLKILPLLAGRLEVDSLALVRPRAKIDLDRNMDAPGAAARAAAAPSFSPEAQKADAFRLGVLNIVDGSLQVTRGGAEYVAQKIAASLDWRRVGEPALLNAAFDWRGERLQAQLWIARPGALLRGDLSVATARLDGENLKLEAQGVAQTGANGRFAGRVAGSAAAVRQAMRLFDLSAPLPGPFGGAQFSAQATFGVKEATLKDLHVIVDGNAFEGELTVRDEDGRPHVDAALTSDFVALKPMLTDAPALLSPEGQWSHEPIEPPDLSGADVDLKITARHARLARLTIDDARVALALRDGVLDLSLVEAEAYRGRLKARASFMSTGGALKVHATAQTWGVDASALLWDGFGKQAVGGALDSSLTLDAAGGNMAEMMRSLAGRATMTLADGEIAGVDFERALRRFEKRPLSSAHDIRSGSSQLDKARATLLIEKGVGELDDGSAQGPGFALHFAGTTNLADRSLSLKAVAREADGSGRPRDKGLQISFDLAGGFDELTLAPDPQAFIRRSGAAAPLLPEPPEPAEDAVR